ncbi:MAG: DUF1364 family protein [Mesorhizobium sp.]|nr:MAG: DUF1364 family protein [Mesorhizobium sp.]
MGIVSTKLRNSARGQKCTLCIPGVCNSDSETTVLAHLGSETKAMGTKSHDFFACFACSSCHYHLDNNRLSELDRLYFSLRGLVRTWEIWVASGHIFIPADTHRSKPLSKTMPRRHIATGEIL